MAEQIISPGVFQRENDISFIQPAPVEVGAAIIGPTVKGPVEIPTTVTSYNEYVRVFGDTFDSGSVKQEYLTSIAAKNYFSQGGNTLLVARAVTGSFTAASSTRISSSNESGVVNTITATGDLSFNSFNITSSAGNGPTGTENAVASATSGTGTGLQLTASYSTSASINTITLSGGSGYASGDTVTFTSQSMGSNLPNGTDIIITLSAANILNSEAFTLETLGKGIIYNNATGSEDTGGHNSDGSLVSGSKDNLRWEVSNVNNALGTFTLAIRNGDDSTKSKTILETFNNLSLDPNSPNYISAIIGDQVKAISATGDNITLTGDYVNRSNYVRVSAVNLKTLNYTSTDGITVGVDSNSLSYSGSLPFAQSGSFFGATGTNVVEAKYFENINANNQGLTDGCFTEKLTTLLGNADEFKFNVISVPGATQQLMPNVVSAVTDLCETRGDAIYVADLYTYGATVANVTGEADEINSSYAAAYWPWLQVSSATGQNVWVPSSTVIPGVYAFTDGANAPWFAPAGLVRGGLVGVIQAERRLSRTQRDSLYKSKVNPIATFPGTGIAVFGQKTLQTKASALDRVNVRRLLIALKEFIGNQANNLVFEQNTVATRNSFLAAVNPYLDSVVQRQGLFAYRVVMDDTNNTADVVDRNQLVGQIFIQPTKTAEFIVLDFVVEPTGATFGN